MSLSPDWCLMQEIKRKFEYFDQETRPRTSVRMIFKFYKNQTKSENHEICQDVMISYVEAVVKIWECFAQFVTYDAYKRKHL